jgi:hypothetical protein
LVHLMNSISGGLNMVYHLQVSNYYKFSSLVLNIQYVEYIIMACPE